MTVEFLRQIIDEYCKAPAPEGANTSYIRVDMPEMLVEEFLLSWKGTKLSPGKDRENNLVLMVCMNSKTGKKFIDIHAGPLFSIHYWEGSIYVRA